MIKVFTMTEKEENSIELWKEVHDKKCKLKKKNRPRFYTYCFTPTGIGTAIKIQCSCGKGEDVTDVSTW
jgi:hypothetical protein